MLLFNNVVAQWRVKNHLLHVHGLTTVFLYAFELKGAPLKAARKDDLTLMMLDAEVQV
jgi:hypothetical protein